MGSIFKDLPRYSPKFVKSAGKDTHRDENPLKLNLHVPRRVGLLSKMYRVQTVRLKFTLRAGGVRGGDLYGKLWE
jgi:hypothetical protein